MCSAAGRNICTLCYSSMLCSQLRPARATPRLLLALPGRRAARSAVTLAVMKLDGKTCAITGANRGIGLELTRQLLAKGNIVIATARDPGAAKDLQKLQAGSGGALTVMQLDVGSPESIDAWADSLKHQVPHIDLLVNNAGVVDGWKDLDEVTEADMLQCFKVNALGPLLVTQQLHQRGLLGGRGGTSVVANMTSKMGSVADNGSGGSYAYRASKAALNIVNKSLSVDLAGDGITSVLLHPGYVVTRMTGFEGLIDTKTCVTGLLSVLESKKELNGRWYDFRGQVVPW